jgi:hypothetical protein
MTVSTGIAVVPIERLHHSVPKAETEITVVQTHPSAQTLGGLEAWRLGGLEAWQYFLFGAGNALSKLMP